MKESLKCIKVCIAGVVQREMPKECGELRVCA